VSHNVPEERKAEIIGVYTAIYLLKKINCYTYMHVVLHVIFHSLTALSLKQ